MTLRAIIDGFAVLMLAAASAAFLIEPAAWPFLAMAGLFAAGCLFERWRYRPVAGGAPGSGWAASGERFVDPETGRLVKVFYDERSGARRYVDAGDGPHDQPR